LGARAVYEKWGIVTAVYDGDLSSQPPVTRGGSSIFHHGTTVQAALAVRRLLDAFGGELIWKNQPMRSAF